MPTYPLLLPAKVRVLRAPASSDVRVYAAASPAGWPTGTCRRHASRQSQSYHADRIRGAARCPDVRSKHVRAESAVKHRGKGGCQRSLMAVAPIQNFARLIETYRELAETSPRHVENYQQLSENFQDVSSTFRERDRGVSVIASPCRRRA